MNSPGNFWPTGTVYGCLLNFRREWLQLGDTMAQPPHKAAPQAPVLYVKTANTWSSSGAGIDLPAGADAVLVGASVAMVMGPRQWLAGATRAVPTVAGYVLVNDLELPGGSYFRPAVKTKCVDGFLGLGAKPVELSAAELSIMQVQDGEYVRIHPEERGTLDCSVDPVAVTLDPDKFEVE